MADLTMTVPRRGASVSGDHRGRVAKAAALVLAIGALSTLPAVAQGVDREDQVFTLAADVFVLDSGLLRTPDGSTPSDAPLFNTAGTPLSLTFGAWRQATATSRAHCPAGGSRTDVRLRMTGLVPSGVYSVFYVTFQPDSRNPLCESQERGLPLVSKDPEQTPDFASFVADPNGEADFQGRVDGCLFEAERLQFVLIYHFDGQTYGELANRGEYVTQGPDCRSSYGSDAMRQVLVVQKMPF